MVNPSRAASASTQTSRLALLTLAKAASGEALSTPLRRRARIPGDAGGDGEPLRGKPGAAVLDQRGFAAEQMGDAGNVEHEAVAAVERGERREARAPVAEPLEKPRLLGRLSLDRDEVRMTRARVGKREADGQAKPRRLGVDANQALRIVDLGYRRERRPPIDAIKTPRAVGREPRQPQGEKSPDRQKPIPRIDCPGFAIRDE